MKNVLIMTVHYATINLTSMDCAVLSMIKVLRL